MNGVDVLFDTNAVIGWIKQDQDLARIALSWSVPCISLFTLGELLFGALKSAKPDKNRALVESAKATFRVLLPSESSCELYVAIRFALRRKGKPIPENDLWISALALEYKIPLLTRDSHFQEVSELRVIPW
jgi:tRNA(fMet)-specific endonuclease VapC